MKSPFRTPRVGLALGSGGPKGLAHIGVLKVLEEARVPIHCIAGSSIGAIVGALYCADTHTAHITRLAETTNWKELRALMDPHFGTGGLLKGDKLVSFLEKSLAVQDFAQLRIPLAVVATNMQTGEPVTFRTGRVAEALRASASMPVVFRPLRTLDGAEYGDGGLSLPVPVQIARAMGADIVIAVDLDAHIKNNTQPLKDVFDIAQRTISFLSFHLAQEQMRYADIQVVPDVSAVGWNAFLTTEGTTRVIQLGESAMRAQLPNLTQRLRYPPLFQKLIFRK